MNPPPLPPPLQSVPPAPVIPPAPPLARCLEEGERLPPTCVAAGIVVLLGDFLLWGFAPGLSLAIFTAVVAVVMMARHPRAALKARVLVPFAMLMASAVQTAIEISFTNCVVIATLFAVLMAELHFTALPAGWARWSESVVAWGCALGRWVWLIQALGEQPVRIGGGARLGERLGRALRIALPAVLLLALFGGVLASGNSIFSEYLSRFWRHLYDWVASFDFSVARILFWWGLATFALTFCRPRSGAIAPRSWTQAPGEWRRGDASIAFWQSAMILGALNVLFFAVNTIDAIFLWKRAAVPAGVVPKIYLHEGVNSLIAATVLAGIVLTILFQQSSAVTGPRVLKALAFAWVAQNLALIAGVFLRLKLYVEMEEMTEKRVYVACFLLLVTLGFGFLCAHVWRGREAGRLIWRNAVATFTLFFVLQFLNVVGWVVARNFARWEGGLERFGLNLAYNLTLGPDAWPVMVDVAKRLPEGRRRSDLIFGLRAVAYREGPSRVNWRESQFRRDCNARVLTDWAGPLGSLSGAEWEEQIVIEYLRLSREAQRR